MAERIGTIGDYAASRTKWFDEFFIAAVLASHHARPTAWYLEERTDVATWLHDHCWQVSAVAADELMARYHRAPLDDSDDGRGPPVFVEGVSNGRPGG